MIEDFIYNKHFHNISLPNNKNTYEKIIQDSTKYNLIAFTASWCAPCMEEIPLLKKIYKDLGRELIVTYISIDNKQSVNTFIKKAREKGIHWRTLFAYHDIEKIRQSYFVESIPQAILVYPNQTMEIIDVRKDNGRSKLYSLVKSFRTKK
jgi:thiol-disulfide isomerase/thioredoxin